MGDSEGQGRIVPQSMGSQRVRYNRATEHAHITYLLTSLAVPGLSCGTWALVL